MRKEDLLFIFNELVTVKVGHNEYQNTIDAYTLAIQLYEAKVCLNSVHSRDLTLAEHAIKTIRHYPIPTN